MTYALIAALLIVYILGMLCGFSMGRYHEITRILDQMDGDDSDGEDNPADDPALASQNWRMQ